jgi:hypothetical protein
MYFCSSERRIMDANIDLLYEDGFVAYHDDLVMMRHLCNALSTMAHKTDVCCVCVCVTYYNLIYS